MQTFCNYGYDPTVPVTPMARGQGLPAGADGVFRACLVPDWGKTNEAGTR